MPRPSGTALMKCPRCQHENPPHAKFCLECGANLALTCAECQSTLPTGAKFCLECGEPVVEPTRLSQRTSAARGQHRHMARQGAVEPLRFRPESNPYRLREGSGSTLA